MSPYSDVAFTRCAAEIVSPLVRRIVAPDGGGCGRSAGLRTYIVGHGDVALIDPDPASVPLLEAILDATEGERITHVLITHCHGRRSPLAAQLAERFGADVLSGDCGLRDGERLYGVDWTLEAIATPGHTPDHFAFALLEEEGVFCGDLVSGWSPEAVAPPGGDLSALLSSIERIQAERFEWMAPAHGPIVAEVAGFLHECLAETRRRERGILAAVAAQGPLNAWRLAAGVASAAHGAGEAHAILAHLVRLAARGDLTSEAPLSAFTPFSLARKPAQRRATIDAARADKIRSLPLRPRHGIDTLSVVQFAAPRRDSQHTSLEAGARQTGTHR
jgi:glyoxylase-like metal-dependent hydrolase (beta-lactamase superfamily II)